MTKLLLPLISTLMLISLSLPSYALKSDNAQPVTLDADEFDLDFQTGVRTYRGNVVYQQGTIRLYADEIVAYFKNGELTRAIAQGSPAQFRQRPEDSDSDVVGIALRIELDDIKQLITLKNRAKVTQDANTITGKLITYNIQTEKVNVRSGKRSSPPPLPPAMVDSTNAETPQNDASKQPAVKVEQSENNRPRLVIQPRN